MEPEIIRTSNFVADAAGFVMGLAETTLRERGRCYVALSGGNTPRPVYADLAKQKLPWKKFLFTFSDERCVPPDNEQSNFRMAREALFAAAKVRETSVLRMHGETEPEQSAREYEKQIDQLAGKKEEIFRHDLILLGLGDDGHTASLFPGTAALGERERRVVANFVPKLNVWRLTMTFPLINAARHVCFLVSGKNEELIEKVLQGDRQYPASRVKPIDGQLTWIIGQAA